MTPNHKLTRVIQGRVVTGVDPATATAPLAVRFGDGSTMTVKTDGTPPDGPTTGTVKDVRQQGTIFQLEYATGAPLVLHMAEASSSVMVRDRNHVMEYAD